MTAAQWIALLTAVLVCLGCLAGLAHEWRITADQTIREAYRKADVPYDDDELAARIAEDERAWREWAAICQVLDIAPDAGTPIYDRLVCDEMERAEGWAS